MPDPIAGRSLETLVEELATATSGAGGGVAAASATALAAALVELVARASYEGWDEAPATATQAQALRVRALELADAESAAFADALAALRPTSRWPAPRRVSRASGRRWGRAWTPASHAARAGRNAPRTGLGQMV